MSAQSPHLRLPKPGAPPDTKRIRRPAAVLRQAWQVVPADGKSKAGFAFRHLGQVRFDHGRFWTGSMTEGFGPVV